ncbi:MAG: zinc ribbon domain-containing protein [Selenomonadaceae bacterium]|nr:zinc ribbon domain-containing protein [Selenomonadaceae bacterium]
MMCQNCGNTLKSGDTVCQICGSPVSPQQNSSTYQSGGDNTFLLIFLTVLFFVWSFMYLNINWIKEIREELYQSAFEEILTKSGLFGFLSKSGAAVAKKSGVVLAAGAAGIGAVVLRKKS